MNSLQFAYWLQGFFEISNTEQLTKEQIDMIRKHLQLVFKNETASMPSNFPVYINPTSDYNDKLFNKGEHFVCGTSTTALPGVKPVFLGHSGSC